MFPNEPSRHSGHFDKEEAHRAARRAASTRYNRKATEVDELDAKDINYLKTIVAAIHKIVDKPETGRLLHKLTSLDKQFELSTKDKQARRSSSDSRFSPERLQHQVDKNKTSIGTLPEQPSSQGTGIDMLGVRPDYPSASPRSRTWYIDGPETHGQEATATVTDDSENEVVMGDLTFRGTPQELVAYLHKHDFKELVTDNVDLQIAWHSTERQ